MDTDTDIWVVTGWDGFLSCFVVVVKSRQRDKYTFALMGVEGGGAAECTSGSRVVFKLFAWAGLLLHAFLAYIYI